MRKIWLSKYVEKEFETPSNLFSEWFGYYNYDTLDSTRRKMLCNRASFDGVKPEKGMEIELGYYDVVSNEWNSIGSSDSWNWQQGAMLQWLPGEENNSKVIYNTSKDQHLISRIHDIKTGRDKDISWPIYGITPDGKRSISLELERSFWCRAYHYASVANKDLEGRVYEGDGIFEIDLENNLRRRIISIQDIIQTDYQSDFESNKHWVEHIMISPSGKRFCFLHRFSPMDNVFKYTTRLMIANIDGSQLKAVPGWETYRWSHFGWKGDDSFVIYTNFPGRYKDVKGFGEIIRKNPFSSDLTHKLLVSLSSRVPYMLGRKMAGFGRYYQVYSLDSQNKARLIERIESSIFDIDGHPSFTNNGRYMITDSYPDKNGMQRLIVYDTLTRKGIIIAKLFAFYKGNPASCDLHPKLCNDNRYLVIDTAYNKKHHMILLQLNWDKIKNKLSDE